ncbi:alpha/beta hydrolase [Streptomyces sp. NPDC051172]|uniref:alpha/beta hydrolase n=1 Tax=Streptomyces sp. NPDC051172 TaxID=3155796 RepID=UPI00342652E8
MRTGRRFLARRPQRSPTCRHSRCCARPGGGQRRRPVLHARGFGARWEARWHLAGACGHLNSASGLGSWPHGRELLDSLTKQ